MALLLMRNTIRKSQGSLLKHICSDLEGIDKRFIMGTRVRLDKALEDLKKNPYFDKYARKIAKLQETNPEEFLERVGTQEAKIKERKEERKRERESYRSKAKPVLDPSPYKQDARLDRIMKVEMIEDKTKEEIVEIWKKYHREKDCICGALLPNQFDKMFDLGTKYPTFLLPLPREQGYEFIVTQFSGSEIHMTPLLWYQTHKENAPECLTMIHYNELRDSKGIVLMRGEFDTKFMSVQEAQCLANELQLYYATENHQRLQLLEIFTNKPNEFKHMDLVAQLETISLEPRAP